MMVFVSENYFQINGKGNVFMVRCPHDCTDFSWIIGKDVEIDGNPYKVTGVEAFAIRQHRQGEQIGLLAKKVGVKTKHEFSKAVLKALGSLTSPIGVEDSDPEAMTATLRLHESLTFAALKSISDALGTDAINIVAATEHGYYPGEADSYVELEVSKIVLP